MKPNPLSHFLTGSVRERLVLTVSAWVAYALAFFPVFFRVGDTVGTLVTLPVMVSAWLFGLRGGLLASLLNIPITALLFELAGISGWEAMIQRWPGIFAGLLIGAVTGWLSDLFHQVGKQSRELGRERDVLQKEIGERQHAEESLRHAHDELETRVEERTAELVKVNAALQADIAERKRAEERINHQVSLLSALRAIDLAISSSLDLHLTLNTLLGHTVSELGVDAAAILLFNRGTGELKYAAARGFRGRQPRRGDNLAYQTAHERRLISVPDLRLGKQQFSKSRLIADEGFVALFAAPLIAKGEVKGVLEVFHRAPLDPDNEWLDFLEALAGQSAIAIDGAELFDELQRSNSELRLAYEKTIEGWSHALDLRDKETEGHALRVTKMTVELATRMGISDSELKHIQRGALLHDIGKMGVPDHILLKSEPLMEAESVIMRKHPQYAYDMLAPIDFLRQALDIPYCHHEKWDGTGYPRGLKGEAIPLAARIFTVVDVWDALCSDRPYRPAWTKEKALEHIRALAGRDFDPQAVDAFLKFTKEGMEGDPEASWDKIALS